MPPTISPTTSHRGAFSVQTDADGGIAVVPHPADPAPSPLLANVPGALRHRGDASRTCLRDAIRWPSTSRSPASPTCC